MNRADGRRPWPLKAAAALMIILFGSGCATDTPGLPTHVPVEIGGDVVLTLPPPDSLGRPVSAAQSVVIRHGNAVIPFEARFSGEAGRVLIVGLDGLGRRTMTLDWTDERIAATTAPWFPRSLPVHNLLADIVTMYWPEETLRRSLSGPDVGLVTDRYRRAIFSGGREIIRIDYDPDQAHRWSGTARYRNLARNYSIEVHSVEVPR